MGKCEARGNYEAATRKTSPLSHRPHLLAPAQENTEGDRGGGERGKEELRGVGLALRGTFSALLKALKTGDLPTP